ncbi:MAG: GxxExxY protein [Spirochaetia bacterium]|nr:GxxExxY protein [Spirochaetia bacterium]
MRLCIGSPFILGINDVYPAQMLTYLKPFGIPPGFFFNFNVRHVKTGVRRVVFSPFRLPSCALVCLCGFLSSCGLSLARGWRVTPPASPLEKEWG